MRRRLERHRLTQKPSRTQRPLGVAQELAGEQHQVGPSVTDDLVGMGGGGDHADRRGRDVCLPTNTLGQGHLEAGADYFAVATFNGLAFDRHAEEEAVDTFSLALREACDQFVLDPLGTPSLPNWARVASALPEAGIRLVRAVTDLGGVINE